MALPDLVWLVRPGDDNEELRYSLRSVARNADGLFRKVWIVGTVPSWVTGVEGLPLDPAAEKFANMRQSLAAVVRDRRVAAQIVVFNDDHFVTEPITEWAAFHLGRTSAYVQHLASIGTTSKRNTWVRAVENTAEWMRAEGHGDIYCYEAHTPLLFNRRALAAALDAYPADRSLAYPGLYPVAGAAGEGVNAGNSKVVRPGELAVKVALPMPYLSSNDASFADGEVGAHIRAMFPEPSPFEM